MYQKIENRFDRKCDTLQSSREITIPVKDYVENQIYVKLLENKISSMQKKISVQNEKIKFFKKKCIVSNVDELKSSHRKYSLAQKKYTEIDVSAKKSFNFGTNSNNISQVDSKLKLNKEILQDCKNNSIESSDSSNWNKQISILNEIKREGKEKLKAVIHPIASITEVSPQKTKRKKMILSEKTQLTQSINGTKMSINNYNEERFKFPFAKEKNTIEKNGSPKIDNYAKNLKLNETVDFDSKSLNYLEGKTGIQMNAYCNFEPTSNSKLKTKTVFLKESAFAKSPEFPKSKTTRKFKGLVFGIIFASSFKKICKINQLKRVQNVIGLVDYNPEAVPTQIIKILRTIFEPIFKSEFFENNSQTNLNRIKSGDLEEAIDFIIAGFHTFFKEFLSQKYKVCHIFIINTLITGAAVLPNSQTYFETCRIKISDRKFYPFYENSERDSFLSISCFIFVKVFLNKFLFEEYSSNQFIVLCGMASEKIFRQKWELYFDCSNQFLEYENLNNSSILIEKGLMMKSSAISALKKIFPTKTQTEKNSDSFFLEIPKISVIEEMSKNQAVCDKISNNLFTLLKSFHQFFKLQFYYFRMAFLNTKLEKMNKMSKQFSDDQFFFRGIESLTKKVNEIKKKIATHN